jgi:antitoxin component of MazEF toxin-antitoxin module
MVGGSAVVSLPRTILQAAQIEIGEKVIVEVVAVNRISLFKEGRTMPSLERLELELESLEKDSQALLSDYQFKHYQYSSSMPVEAGMEDNSDAQLRLQQLIRDRHRIEAEIAKKRLLQFDLQGVIESRSK